MPLRGKGVSYCADDLVSGRVVTNTGANAGPAQVEVSIDQDKTGSLCRFGPDRIETFRLSDGLYIGLGPDWMEQPPPLEPPCRSKQSSYLVIGVKEQLNPETILGQLLRLVRLARRHAEEPHVELVELVLTLTQLREQFEARQSAVVAEYLQQDRSVTELCQRLERAIVSLEGDVRERWHVKETLRVGMNFPTLVASVSATPFGWEIAREFIRLMTRVVSVLTIMRWH